MAPFFEAIEFENGKILNGRMSEYRGPRFSDVPVLETVLLDRKGSSIGGRGRVPRGRAGSGNRQCHS